MKKNIYLFLLPIFFLLFMQGSYSSQTQEITGTWLSRGKISGGSEYSGTVEISKTYNDYYASGRFYIGGETGERIASFWSAAAFDGRRLKFKFYIRQTPGLIRSLEGLGRSGTADYQRIEVEGDYVLSEDGNAFQGTWKSSDNSLDAEDIWKKKSDKIEVFSISPDKVETGVDREMILTITGSNFPDQSEFNRTRSELVFLKEGRIDDMIQVKQVLEVSDDGTSLKVLVSFYKNADLGSRDVQVKKGLGKDLLSITKASLKLPLGGSLKARAGDTVKVYIPNGEGGRLVLSGAEIRSLHQGNPRGAETILSGNDFEIKAAGWYYFSMPSSSGDVNLSCSYTVEGETPKENKPWNFWYWPYYDKSMDGLNLYDDGGVYEKLDRVLGILPQKDGWKDFDVTRHMDYQAGFRLPEGLQERERYNPTTIKGYAWCYQRTTDSSKGWWGYCNGAVMASSLYSQPPQSKTLLLPDGTSLHFTQEELEGILTSYYIGHSWLGINFVNFCPPGRPTARLEEDVDYHCDDFFQGLVDGIGKQGRALASNLRAESTNLAHGGQVWNHVIWKFKATLEEVDGDPTFVKVNLTIYANMDIFPSDESKGSRVEDYILTLKYNPDGTLDRDNKKYQNWIYAKHFCPYYMSLIQGSFNPDCTENEVLRGKIHRLIEVFGFKKID